MEINGVTNPNVCQQGCVQQPQNINVPPSASGVNINIYNPSAGAPTSNVIPDYYKDWAMGGYNTCPCCHSQNSNVNNSSNNTNVNSNTNTSTTNVQNTEVQENYENNPNFKQKRITVINDDYIKTLEQWLNSEETSNRKSAAKQVLERLQEDKRRYDNPALNALVNKMLQDPSQDVRSIALLALDSRLAKGDDYTKGVLEKMTKDNSNFGLDAKQAADILLKMSADTKLVYERIASDKK